MKTAPASAVFLLFAFCVKFAACASRADATWQEFASSGVCRPEKLRQGRCRFRNETDAESDTQQPCSCSVSCSKYGFCCSDAPVQRRFPQIYTCRKLIGNYGYVLSKCPPSWIDESVRSACEDVDESVNDLRTTAVYVRRTLYGSIYCAVCNRVADEESIELQISCPLTISEPLPDPSSVVYNATTNTYNLVQGSRIRNCSVHVPRTVMYETSQSDNIRFCLPTVDTCAPDWQDTEVARKCRSYSMRIYADVSDEQNNGSSTVSYRNYHCALCNRADKSKLSCTPFGTPYVRVTERSLTVLINMNASKYGGGSSGSRRPCSSSEYYDPYLRSCMRVSCSRGEVWKVDRCVRRNKI